MERLGGDQSGQSDIRLTAICADCGQEFNAKAALAVQAFTRKRQPLYCHFCRAKMVRQGQVEQTRRHEVTLAYWRNEWLSKAGLPFAYLLKNFDNYDPAFNEPRVALLRAYVEAFPVDQRPTNYPSLIITARNNGVGKTHLSCAMLQGIIARFENLAYEHSPFRFYTAPALKHRILDAQRFTSKDTLVTVYEELASLWLLILDDVGKEKLTGADAGTMGEIYFSIINDRYNAGLPLVLTSNLGFEPWEAGGLCLEDVIGWAACSRLKEMTGSPGQQIVIAGEDRR